MENVVKMVRLHQYLKLPLIDFFVLLYCVAILVKTLNVMYHSWSQKRKQ